MHKELSLSKHIFPVSRLAASASPDKELDSDFLLCRSEAKLY